MAADTAPWTARRSFGWGVALLVVVATALRVLHALDVRHRPELLPVVPDSTTHVDAFGDPLPVGAVARLGSRRYRVGPGAGLAILPDGERFVAGMADGRVGVFDVATGRRLRTLTAQRGFRKTVASWSLRDLDPFQDTSASLRWEPGRVDGLFVRPDGHVDVVRFARQDARTGTALGPLRVSGTSTEAMVELVALDVATGARGQPRFLPTGFAPPLAGAWVSPDGKDVVVRDGSVGGLFAMSVTRRGADPDRVRMLDAATGVPRWSTVEDVARVPGWTATGTVRLSGWTRDLVVERESGKVRHEPPSTLVRDPPYRALLPDKNTLVGGTTILRIEEREFDTVIAMVATALDLAESEWSNADVSSVRRKDGSLVVALRSTSGLVQVFDTTRVIDAHEDAHHRAIARVVWGAGGQEVVSLDVVGDVRCWQVEPAAVGWLARSRLDGTWGADLDLSLDEREVLVWLNARRPHRDVVRFARDTGAWLPVAAPFRERLNSANLAWFPRRGHLAGLVWSIMTAEPRQALTLDVYDLRDGACVARLPYVAGTFQLDAVADDGRSARVLVDDRRLPRRLLELHPRTVTAGAPPIASPAAALPEVVLRRERPAFLAPTLDRLWTEGCAWPSVRVLGLPGQLELQVDGAIPEPPLRWPQFGEALARVEIAPDGRYGVLFDGRRRALLLDLASGTSPFAFPTIPAPVTAVDWRADGRRVVTGGADGTILIWDLDAMIAHGR